MRISLRQLEAIESDHYQSLPGAVFVRGFVRNYARLLNLDPAPLLQALEPALGTDSPLRAQHYEGAMPDARSGRARFWLAVFGVLVAAVLGAAAYEYWLGRFGDEPIVSPVSQEPVAAPATEPSSPPAPATAAEPVPLAPERVSDVPPGPAKDEAGAVPGAGSVEADRAQTSGAGGRLRIEFLQDAWVEVKTSDGTVVYSGTGTGGSERTIDSPPPLALVIGNASGVRITYNQQLVDVAARATRNIARFTLE
jgi:cytoskeleton protein RodZ